LPWGKSNRKQEWPKRCGKGKSGEVENLREHQKVTARDGGLRMGGSYPSACQMLEGDTGVPGGEGLLISMAR